MSKFVIAFLLGVSSVVYAQGPDSTAVQPISSSSVVASDDTAQMGPAGPQESTPHRRFGGDMLFGARDHDVHENPVASFTASYVYTFTDSQHGNNRSLMGWSAVPEVRLTKYIDMQGDFEGLYVRSVYPGENRFLIAAGPRYTFAPHSRFTPFIFAEGGEVRLTSQANHNSDWNPVVKGGIGLQHKISRGIAFQLIPGEYMGQQLDDHTWEHSFVARAGLTFNLYK